MAHEPHCQISGKCKRFLWIERSLKSFYMCVSSASSAVERVEKREMTFLSDLK